MQYPASLYIEEAKACIEREGGKGAGVMARIRVLCDNYLSVMCVFHHLK